MGTTKGAALLAATAIAAVTSVVAAPSAEAAVFRCMYFDQNICATVTAIRPGSALVLHNQPNYSGGVVPGSPRMQNGRWFLIVCWTTGARDADGHGDRYWFRGNAANSSGRDGYVNDWYLTTGSYREWSRYVRHC